MFQPDEQQTKFDRIANKGCFWGFLAYVIFWFGIVGYAVFSVFYQQKHSVIDALLGLLLLAGPFVIGTWLYRRRRIGN